MRYCQFCGSEVQEASVFCENCGKNLNEENSLSKQITNQERKCKTCGTIFSKTLRQCPNCGASSTQVITARLIKCKHCNHYIAENVLRCPHCRKPAKQFFIIIFAVFMFAFMIIVSMPKPSKNNIENTNGTTENIELTDEEKAQIETEKATTKFSEGKYREALEICSNAIALYPNTETANNMDVYIKEQYAQFPQYTAKQLMSEYESNIVNADEKYTGNVMIVSGVVSKIAKTNNDKNLCVLLKSGTYFWSVQLNFDTSQTEAVSALREGETVKAIGKCTGKSGKHFLIIDGENIMIEDCLFVR